MHKVLLAGVTALSLVAAPTASFARDHNDGWRDGRGGDRGWNNQYNGRWNGNRHYDRRDDNDDAVAAGVIGLVLGAALGAALSNPEPRRGPPQGYGYNNYPPPSPPQPYYEQGYGNQGYQGGQCFRRELQWDPRSRQNIEVTVPYPC